MTPVSFGQVERRRDAEIVWTLYVAVWTVFGLPKRSKSTRLLRSAHPKLVAGTHIKQDARSEKGAPLKSNAPRLNSTEQDILYTNEHLADSV
jgi:hypothetical protein